MQHSGPFPLALKSPDQGLGGKDCQNGSQGKPCQYIINISEDTQDIPQLRSTVIRKTYLYNFDPLKPYFYIVNQGLTGVYIIFLISAKNIDCGYLLEPPRQGGSYEYPQSMF